MRNWIKRLSAVCMAAAVSLGLCGTAFAEGGTGGSGYTASAETIDLIFVLGQSNAGGWEGYTDGSQSAANVAYYERGRGEAVACDEDEIFSTYIPLRQDEAKLITGLYGWMDSGTSLLAEDVYGYLPAAVGSDTTQTGTALEYRTNALSVSGTGKTGMDGAIAYEWNRLTGHRVWITNISCGGTKISEWVPGGTVVTADGGRTIGEPSEYFESAVNAIQGIIGLCDADSSLAVGTTMVYWLQGESDSDTPQDEYQADLEKIVDGLTALVPDLQFGIIRPRCLSSGDPCRDFGVTRADEAVAAEYGNVHLVSDVNRTWDSDAAVADYWAARYPDGISYPTRGGVTLSLPTACAEIYGFPHYTQIGHNENGLDAARGMFSAIHVYDFSGFEWTDGGCEAVFTCLSCGQTETRGADVTAETEEPTCGRDGAVTYRVTCTSGNGITYTGSRTDEIPATGAHVWTETVIGPACGEVGYTVHTCAVCGESYTDSYVAATDHDYAPVSFVWTDENGRIWDGGDEDFVWNENVTCRALLKCTVCGKDFTAACTVTMERDETGMIFTATVGDSDLRDVITVSGEESEETRSGEVTVSGEIDGGTVSGAEAGDPSAEDADREAGIIDENSEEDNAGSTDTDNTESGEENTGTDSDTKTSGNGGKSDGKSAGEPEGKSESPDGPTAVESPKTGDSAGVLALCACAAAGLSAGAAGIMAAKRAKEG